MYQEIGYNFPLELITDYPSIGQVNYLARKHNVHVIWAVTEDKFRLYKELAKMVEGSSAGIISRERMGKIPQFWQFQKMRKNVCKILAALSKLFSV